MEGGGGGVPLYPKLVILILASWAAGLYQHFSVDLSAAGGSVGLGQRALLCLGQASEEAGQLPEAARAGDHLALGGGALEKQLSIVGHSHSGCL